MQLETLLGRRAGEEVDDNVSEIFLPEIVAGDLTY